MSKKNLVLAPFFACALLLIMGALNHQAPVLSQSAENAFLAQPVSLDQSLTELSPRQILNRAAAGLDPSKTQWLRLTTWQKQSDEEISFEAEGRLVRGPRHCARMEMTIHRGSQDIKVVTVSDGVDLAHARHLPGLPADVTTTRITTPGQPVPNPDGLEQILKAQGCGGPHCILKELENLLDNLKATRGLWKNKPVIRLTGTLKYPSDDSPDRRFTVPPKLCRVYLDARSLWPHRVEWLTSPSDEDFGFLLLQMEFRDPEINQPLTHDDCVREFTYVSEG